MKMSGKFIRLMAAIISNDLICLVNKSSRDPAISARLMIWGAIAATTSGMQEIIADNISENTYAPYLAEQLLLKWNSLCDQAKLMNEADWAQVHAAVDGLFK